MKRPLLSLRLLDGEAWALGPEKPRAIVKPSYHPDPSRRHGRVTLSSGQTGHVT